MNADLNELMQQCYHNEMQSQYYKWSIKWWEYRALVAER